jgi:hypothetical protein
VISGLDESDYIDLKDLTYTSGQMAASTSYSPESGHTTLVVSNNSTSQSVSFTLAGNYTSSSWIFANDGAGGTIFHDPPAADANATTTAAPTPTDLTLTVTAALTTQDGAADQFTFQSDSQSGTLAGDSTLAASAQDASTSDAATLDANASADNQPTATATAAADTGLASTAATTSQPATTDSAASGTQAGAATQTATAAPGPNGDTFVFAANFGHETIANFHPETDVIEIDHTVFADFQALLAATHDDGSGNAVIAANPNDTITVKNVTVAQLIQHQSDFHFT